MLAPMRRLLGALAELNLEPAWAAMWDGITLPGDEDD